MKTLIAFLTFLLFPLGSVFPEAAGLRHFPLTQSELEKIRQERHAFYRAKSEGTEQAIKEQRIGREILLDGNQADWDVRYYGIDISLDFTTQTIRTRVDYQIQSLVGSLNFLTLNLRSELTVDSVKVEGAGSTFSHSNHLLTVNFPSSYGQNQEFGCAVYYHGTPHFDGSAGMLFDNILGYDMCWTKCSPFRSRYWWPCKDYTEDKPESLDLYITIPSAYDVASNGAAVSTVDLGGGRKQVHYKHNYPIATYLVAITCADFDVTSKLWNYQSYSMPVYSYTLPSAPQSEAAYDSLMRPVLTHLSDAYGVYPFVDERAGNANFGWQGAMEHQTCNFYNPTFYTDWVIAHETAHQWWGDMITCRTFNHIWLNEGFATYSEALFYERFYGSFSYFDWMQSMKFLGSGTIYVENLATDNIYDPGLTYDKAAWVVHMLRGVLGDSLFFEAIADWYDSPFKYGSATTADFTDVLSVSVGSDMSWFVNQWIYGDGHPDYEISWLCELDTFAGDFELSYYIAQVQEGGTYFKMPIRTLFIMAADTVDTVIWNQGSAQLYTLHFPDSVRNIVVDPEEWILRTVQTLPFTMHITTFTLPEGTEGIPYYQQLEAIGGQLPYHWTKIGGDIPLGLSFEGDTVGTISGTPTWPATYYFTIQLTDASVPPLSETRAYALTINPPGLCGDVNAGGIVNIADVVYLIAYIFTSGPPPQPLESGDVNCNGIVNISDVVYLIGYIFSSGPEPCFDCP